MTLFFASPAVVASGKVASTEKYKDHMSRLLSGVIGLVAGYLIGAGLGAGLVSLLSSNAHDKSLEIAMTAIFFAGPLGAAVGLLAGLVWPRRKGHG